MTTDFPQTWMLRLQPEIQGQQRSLESRRFQDPDIYQDEKLKFKLEFFLAESTNDSETYFKLHLYDTGDVPKDEIIAELLDSTSTHETRLVSRPDILRLYNGARVRIRDCNYTVKLSKRDALPDTIALSLNLSMKLSFTAAIEQGKREHQEDALGWYDQTLPENEKEKDWLWLLTDGVGAASGKIASQYAIEKVLWDYFSQELQSKDPHTRLLDAIMGVHTDLVDYGQRCTPPKQAKPTRVATTLAALLLHKRQWHLFMVGDSPIFYYRHDENHATFEAYNRHDGNRPLRYALGNPGLEIHEIQQMTLDVTGMDNFLLCSDGLTNGLGEDYDEIIRKYIIKMRIQANKGESNLLKTVHEIRQKPFRDNMSFIWVDYSATSQDSTPSLVLESDQHEQIIKRPTQAPKLVPPEIKKKRWFFGLFK
jgi:serine/threonine protein phosphatase PrpC